MVPKFPMNSSNSYLKIDVLNFALAEPGHAGRNNQGRTSSDNSDCYTKPFPIELTIF